MEQIEYEQKYERYRKLGTQLGLMMPKAVWKIRVDNPDGSVIKRTQIARSWNRNAYNWMFTQLGAVRARDATPNFGNGYTSFRSVAGTIYYDYEANCYRFNDTDYGYKAAAGEDDWGIVVGTGTGAESFDGYTLGTKIVHGNSSGQLSYNACDKTNSWAGGSLEMTNSWERIFNNNGGTTIAVAEIGLYANIVITSTVYPTMVIRDLVSPAIDVIDTAQLTVTYDIILTYPE